jgi:translation elongation factor EF-Tu-like GTPase
MPSRIARSIAALALVVLSGFAFAQQPAAPAHAKPLVNVGVLGQTGAGKTTLTAAIVKLQAAKGLAHDVDLAVIDKPATDTASGVGIAAAHVEYETEGRRYAHVDMPRSVDYVKGLITGAAPMDCAIVVVSAVDGPKPQTREHVRLAQAAGVQCVAVFLNKVDLVADEEALGIAEGKARDLLSSLGYPGEEVPVIRGSALRALDALRAGDRGADVESIERLLMTLDGMPVPQRDADAATHSIEPHTRFGALAYFLTQQEGGRSAPITTGYRPQLRFGTTDVAGGVELAIATRAMPGDQAEIEVKLTSPVELAAGTRFAIREGGRTVAAGLVTEVLE